MNESVVIETCHGGGSRDRRHGFRGEAARSEKERNHLVPFHFDVLPQPNTRTTHKSRTITLYYTFHSLNQTQPNMEALEGQQTAMNY